MSLEDLVTVKRLELITYGCGDAFDADRFDPVKNCSYFVKPSGGLWASPVGSRYGWTEWCLDNDYGDFSTEFSATLVGRVLTINTLEDLIRLPEVEPPEWARRPFTRKYVDFEALLAMGVDAVHLTADGECETRFSEPSLYGWDCESVLVMNPACLDAVGAQHVA